MSTRDTLLRSQRRGVHPPLTVREAQHMLDRVPTMVWSGADGGFTTPAPGGLRTWWFGDSVTVNGFLHNTTIVQTDGLMAPEPHTVIPADGDIIYWPAFGEVMPDGRLLVPSAGLVPHSTGWDVKPMRAAYVTVNDDGRVEFDEWAAYWPPGLTGGNASQRYDTAVLDPGTDVLHVYARPADGEMGVYKGVFHRQVPRADVGTESAWSAPQQIVDYVTDGSWSPWIDEDTGLWHALSMTLDTRTVLVYTAEGGAGPWHLSDEIPSPWEPDGTPGERFYVLHAHPWLTLLDTAVVNGTEHPALACTVSHTSNAGQRPHSYRPRFLSIPHPSSGPGVLWYYRTLPGGVTLGWSSSTISAASPEPGTVTLTWADEDGITTPGSPDGTTTLEWTTGA